MADRSALPLSTPDRIRAIAEASISAVRALFEPDDETPIGALRARFHLGATGLRFCAVAAGQLARPELFDVLVAAVDVFPHFDRVEEAVVDDLAEGLSILLRAGAPLTPDVVRLARHRDERIRHGIADGLRPAGAPEIALLQELAAEPSPRVRHTARTSLGDRAALPWWLGKWSHDPTASLTADEQHAHLDALHRIAAILDGDRWGVGSSWTELTSLAAGLPDAPALDLAEMLLRTHEAGGLRDGAIPALVLSRPGGDDALLRLLRRWDGDVSTAYRGARAMSAALAATPRAQRAPIVRELVRLALTGSLEERRNPFRTAGMAAQIARDASPPGEDTEPGVDDLLKS